MMKFPFSRKPRDQDLERPSSVFASYCAQERERLRDAGESFDETRFQAAVELAMARLKDIEREAQP